MPASWTFSSPTATPITWSVGRACCWKTRRRHLHRRGSQRRRLLQDQSSSARLLGGRLRQRRADGHPGDSDGRRCFLLHNRDRSGNHWLTLDLEGTQSNRNSFGAAVKVSAGGRQYFAEARCAFGFLMQSDRRLHFGLGKASTVDRIEVRWPSKQLQELRDVKADQILKVREPGKRK